MVPAVAALAVLSGVLLSGDTSFVGVSGALPAAMAIIVLGILLLVSTIRGHRHAVRLTIALRIVALVLVVGSCFVLLDLIELVIDHRVSGPDGDSHWLAFAERLVSVSVGALFWAAAGAQASTKCRCGQRHTADSPSRLQDPPATSAGPKMLFIAVLGCLAFVPYLGIHGVHAAGLAPELDSLYENQRVLPGSPLVEWLLFVTFLIGPAVFLLQGLVRGWGIVFPQWIPWIGGRRVLRLLPLVPAWLVAPTLTLYGFGSIVYAVFVHASLVGLGGAASLAFACYGTALTLAALSYQRRTRPVCEAARRSQQK